MKTLINSLSARVRSLSDELLTVSKQLEGALNLDAMDGLSDAQKAQLFEAMFPKESSNTSKAIAHLLDQQAGRITLNRPVPEITKDESDKPEKAPAKSSSAASKSKRKSTSKPASESKKGTRTEITPDLILKGKALDAEGHTKQAIAKTLGISYPIVLKILKGFYDGKLPAPKPTDTPNGN